MALPFRLTLPPFLRTSPFSAATRGGPQRVLIIAACGVGMLALVIGASLIHHSPPTESRTAKMPYINPLPGGTKSNPLQDTLALRSAQDQAATADKKGESYTPPMPASQPLKLAQAAAEPEAPPAAPAAHQPVVVPAPRPIPVPSTRPAAAQTGAYPHTLPVSAQVAPQDPQAQQAYKNAINQLLASWDGRAPQTNIVFEPEATAEGGGAGPRLPVTNGPATSAPSGKPSATAVADPPKPAKVLIPSGRGIYAHTVLAVNSDTGGPLVLQADSGPIAGDRMLATFSKNGYDRLVVRVTSVQHQGRTLDANAIVVAPDSMETAVASSVDEHYLERFLLPAAAAFVQGLGQAIATTNTTSTISPLTGSVTGFTKLNIGQQMGVAAGAAAQQVGSALSQEAPKGPTINLAANVNVGVMFLGSLNDAE